MLSARGFGPANTQGSDIEWTVFCWDERIRRCGLGLVQVWAPLSGVWWVRAGPLVFLTRGWSVAQVVPAPTLCNPRETGLERKSEGVLSGCGVGWAGPRRVQR